MPDGGRGTDPPYLIGKMRIAEASRGASPWENPTPIAKRPEWAQEWLDPSDNVEASIVPEVSPGLSGREGSCTVLSQGAWLG